MYFKTETLVGAFIVLALTLFIYMSLQLGSVRLNLARYATYTAEFKDVSNLLPAGDVKIAGVKVGWVDSVHLNPDTMRVDVVLKLLKEYRLYKDAAAMVRQEGLLGVKFLELMPGTSVAERIEPGGALVYQDQEAIGIDQIAQQIERLGTSLEESSREAQAILISIRERLTYIDKVFTDLGLASESFQETAGIVKKAGKQVNQLLTGTGEQKDSPISRGSLAQLITDDQLYRDIKITSDYARGCVERIQNFCVGLDSHLEVLPRSFHERFLQTLPDGETTIDIKGRKTDVKWYLDGYLSACGGYFGKLGLTYSNQGFAKHRGIVCPDDKLPPILGHRNGIRLNLQVGKYWHPYGGVRVGIFEGTAGVGVDLWLTYNRFRWFTTFEAFDFRGRNRFDFDKRPHLKWLNRLFFSDNVYLTFGADDFISKCHRSGFVGIGALVSLPNVLNGC